MYEKYLAALKLMDAAVETKKLVEPVTGWGAPYSTSGIHPCHQAWDDLFDFVFSNFARPKTAIDSGAIDWTTKHLEVDLVRPLIDRTYKTRGEEIEQVLRGIPPKLAEEIFPVGIARYLYRDAELPLRHPNLRTIVRFHYLYGTMILCC